jgi:hypothetical protein
VLREVYAWNNLRNVAKVDSLAAWLEPRRDRLSAFEAAYVDRGVARTHSDFGGVYRASHTMLRLRPTSANAMYMAARDALPVNRAPETVKLFKKFDLNDPELPQGIDTYRDYSVALHAVGDDRKALKVIEEGMARYPDREALLFKLAPLAGLGRVDELNRLADDTELEPRSKTSQGPNPGIFMLTAASELAAHGHEEAAKAMAARSAAWLSANKTNPIPNAEALLLAGDVRAAEAIIDTIKALPDSVGLMAMRAVIEAAKGDRKRAESLDDALGRMPVREEAPYVIARHRARIAAVLGDKDRAVRLLREALAAGLAFNPTLHADPSLHKLAGYKPYDDLMRPRD